MKQVLVTRPEHQNAGLCQAIADLGAQAVALPTLVIEWIAEQALEFEAEALLVFTSVNAVQGALASGFELGKARIAAIGPATAKALARQGLSLDIVAAPANSEGLFQAIQNAPHKFSKIHLISGEDGRQWLEDQLLAAHYSVQKHAVYRRVFAAQSAENSALIREFSGLIVTGSDAALEGLRRIAQKDFANLSKMPLVINSQRGVQMAKALGFGARIYVPTQAGDDGQLACIQQWLAKCND